MTAAAPAPAPAPAPDPRTLPAPAGPSQREFIALMGMLMAFVAFSIDAMLPAITAIGADLSPQDPLRAQLVVPVFLIGLGVGTLFTGPLSDAHGRRPVVMGGAALFCVGAMLAALAPTLELLLAARLVQGIGASGARVVALAIVRDRFSGREMARITSMIITVFTLVPAIAPTIGAGLMWAVGWRGIFGAFVVFAAAIVTWFALSQPETLDPAHRRRLRLRDLRAALREIAGHPLVVRSIAVQITCFAMLFTMLSVTQPIFDRVLGAADTFHFWFGGVVVIAIAGPLMNTRLVMRHGLHRIVSTVLSAQIAACLLYAALLVTGLVPETSILAFFLWQVGTFAMAGMTLGNLNAMAMEPLGHIAGTASSLIAALGTAGAAMLAIPAARLFEDSQLPIVFAICAIALAGRLILFSRAFDPVRHPG